MDAEARGDGDQRGRRLFSESGIYLFGVLATGCISLIGTLVFARLLGPDGYGEYALLLALTGALSGVLMLGGDVVIGRLWFDGQSPSEKGAFAFTWISFLFAWSVVAVSATTAVLLLVHLEISVRVGLLVVACWSLIPLQAGRLLAQVLRNSFRPWAFVVSSVAPSAIGLVAGLALAGPGQLGVSGIVLGLAVASVCALAFGAVLARRHLTFRTDWTQIPGAMKLGIPLVPATVAFWVFSGLDRVFVARYGDVSAVGAYALAGQVVAPIFLFSGAVMQAWLPRAYQANETGPLQAAAAAYRTCTLALAAFGIGAVAASQSATWVISLLGGSGYEAGSQALPMLATGAALVSASSFGAAGATLRRRTAMAPVITVTVGTIDVLLLMALVPSFGIRGAGAAVMLSYVALFAGSLAYSLRVNPAPWAPIHLLLLIVVLCGQALVASALPASGISVFCGILAIFVAVMVIRSQRRRSLPPHATCEGRQDSQ